MMNYDYMFHLGGKVEYRINLVTGVVPTDGASPYLILFGEQVDSGKDEYDSKEL